ncbi:nuclear transport factor 2 family protein [Streptomyces sp. NPDC087917]|uniref:nuclear transport factor 2 family protein n=1 Tax=unclassified Streptomyces TaxID=2593676 RepID=UPI0034214129
MTATNTIEASTSPAGEREGGFGLLYAQVQQFYSRQMQLFDSFEAEPWALTFTEDAVFDVPTLPAPVVGRAALASNVRRNEQNQAAAGEQMRHWLGMLDVRQRPDGSLETRSYALVYLTVRGGESTVHRVCVMEDVLVRASNGWQVSHRLVTRDDLA